MPTVRACAIATQTLLGFGIAGTAGSAVDRGQSAGFPCFDPKLPVHRVRPILASGPCIGSLIARKWIDTANR